LDINLFLVKISAEKGRIIVKKDSPKHLKVGSLHRYSSQSGSEIFDYPGEGYNKKVRRVYDFFF